MKRKDFEQILGAEPRSNDADFLEARGSSAEFAALARDADAFESKLVAAIKIPVEADFADQLLSRLNTAEPAIGLSEIPIAVDATMNREEFEQMLGAEPRSNDSNFLQARGSSAEFAALARDADAFEAKLEGAIKVPIEADYADQLLSRLNAAEPAIGLSEQQSVAASSYPSMNREAFEQILGAEPRSSDPDFVEARRGSIEFAALARDANAFEEKLEAAIKVPVEADYSDQVLSKLAEVEPTIGASAKTVVTSLSRWTRIIPIAASIAAIFALGIMIGRNTGPDPLQQVFAAHVTHEEYALDLTDPIELRRVQAAFAMHGAKFQLASDSKVTYMATCVMGGKVGLHLVVVDDQGEHSTVMYLPDEADVREGMFSSGNLPGRMIKTEDGGVTAVFSHDGQPVSESRYVL